MTLILIFMLLLVGEKVNAQPTQTNRHAKEKQTNSQPSATPQDDRQSKIDNAANAASPGQNQERDAKDEAFKAEQLRQNERIADSTVFIAWATGLNVVAAVTYALFAIFSWLAIKRQAQYAREQVGKLQGQLDAMGKQEGYLRTQAESMQAQAGIMEGQLAVMKDTLTHSERQILLGQTQMQIAGEAMKISRQGVENAERSSIYAQRAYVVAKIKDTGPYDDQLQFRLRIENSGNTPANDVVVLYAFGLREKPPHEASSEGVVVYDIGFTHIERLGLIAPNGSYHVITTIPPVPLQMPITSEGFKRWESCTDKFYCWGRIVYEDIFNEKRHTDFCFLQSQRHINGCPCKHGNQAI